MFTCTLKTKTDNKTDDFVRLEKLRVTAEMSPAVFHIVDQFQHNQTLRFDFDRVHQAGGKITIGTDWPVITTPNLFPAMAGVLDNLDPLYVRGEEMALMDGPCHESSASIVLSWLTLGAAEVLGRDSIVGSIEPGKKASFIMVDRDLSKGCFEEAVVLKTWFEGDLVWDIEGS